MNRKFKFADGEKVLCYQEFLLYEAKVLKRAVEKKTELKYFIHYAGWNKKWDEWVSENRVIKYTEENLRKQLILKNEELNRRMSQRKPKGKKPQVNDSKDSGATSSGNTGPTPSTSSNGLEASASISTVTKAVSSARGLLSKENVTKLPIGKDDEKEAAETTKKSGRPSASTRKRLPVAEDDKPSTSSSNRLPVAEEDKPSKSTSNKLPLAEVDNGEPVPKRKRGRPLSKENKNKIKQVEKQEEKDDSDAGPSTSYIIRKLFGPKRR